MAEILQHSEFGIEIYNTIKNNNYTINLEIGSQDGAGSTQCFIKAMDEINGKDMALYCVEVRDDYKEKIKTNTANKNYVHIIDSCIDYNDFLPKDFDNDVWNSPYRKIYKHGYDEVKGWYTRDVEWLKNVKCAFLRENPDMQFDAVFIDGGEFNGYSEFKLLENRTKCFILDDYYSAYKCSQVFDELINNKKWTLIKSNPYHNNGYAIFKNEYNNITL